MLLFVLGTWLLAYTDKPTHLHNFHPGWCTSICVHCVHNPLVHIDLNTQRTFGVLMVL